MHLERIALWTVRYSESPRDPLQTLRVYGFRRACRRAQQISTRGPRWEAHASRRGFRAFRALRRPIIGPIYIGPIYKGGKRDDY